MNTNLIGREVYINKSPTYVKDNFASFITGRKLYIITKQHTIALCTITDDRGYPITILLNPHKCAYLDHKFGWTLKRLPKKDTNNAKSS